MPENQRLVDVYRAAYEAVQMTTNGIVARCQRYGVSLGLALLDNPTLKQAAAQMHIIAILLESLDHSGLIDPEDLMMPARARGCASTVKFIAEAFDRDDEEEVRRLISELTAF